MKDYKLQLIENNIQDHYFVIKEKGDKLIFKLKNFVPFFEKYLIIKHRKTGKRLSIPIKRFKAVLTASELDELDEFGYYNIYLQVLFDKEVFFERSNYHFQNAGKQLLDYNNGKIAEFYPTKRYNLSFEYKKAPYQAELSSIKLDNDLLELNGIINLISDVDFDEIEFLIFSKSKGRAFPCKYKKIKDHKLTFKCFIGLDFNENLLNTSWDTKIRLIKGGIIIYNANLKTYKILGSDKNEDRILVAANSSDDKELSEIFYTDNLFNLKLEITTIEKSYNLIEMAKGEDIYNHYFNKFEIDDHLIFFESFNGIYSGNPKYIYEKMIELGYDKDFKFVWNLNDNNEIPGNPIVVSNRSEDYYKYLAKAKYWVNNSNFPRLYKRGKIYLQTWHGTPYKNSSYDVRINDENHLSEFSEESHNWNFLVSSNEYSTKTFKEHFNYKKGVLELGNPANDIFYTENQDFKNFLRNKLNIPKDKTIILYAPTFRKKALHLDFKRLHDYLHEDYILIVKNHPNSSAQIEIDDDIKDFALNLSDYDIHELFLISDILITDYSSVIFDFAHTGKPILFYVPDIEAYLAQRRLNIEVRNDLPGPQLTSIEDLINSIKNISELSQSYMNKYENFYCKYCNIGHGTASEEIIKAVFDNGD